MVNKHFNKSRYFGINNRRPLPTYVRNGKYVKRANYSRSVFNKEPPSQAYNQRPVFNQRYKQYPVFNHKRDQRHDQKHDQRVNARYNPRYNPTHNPRYNARYNPRYNRRYNQKPIQAYNPTYTQRHDQRHDQRQDPRYGQRPAFNQRYNQRYGQRPNPRYNPRQDQRPNQRYNQRYGQRPSQRPNQRYNPTYKQRYSQRGNRSIKPFYSGRRLTKYEIAEKWTEWNLFGKEFHLKLFSDLMLTHFFKDFGLDKKLVMHNYWSAFRKIVGYDFSFSYPWAVRNNFYKGLIRNYMKAITIFMCIFLKRLKDLLRRKEIKFKLAFKGFYRVYRVFLLVQHLSNLYERLLSKPDYYFPGYRNFLRIAFFRCLSIFYMKIFLLANKIFVGRGRINSPGSFFFLWKKVYKNWLDIYYQKINRKRLVSAANPRAFISAKLTRLAVFKRKPSFWRNLFRFRLELSGYRKYLLKYFYAYGYTNFGTENPFTYRRKKYRFKLNVLGKRVYLVKKPLFRRKSRKYINWFKSLVTNAYYFSQDHADKTFFRAGYGKRAWISRRRAKHVFKMKFVFIRYFCKKFGLKNRTAFLRKAEHVARKGGNKWLRYYREFESRLSRVLVLFGFCSGDNMAKSIISNNWVLINKKIVNDHRHTFIPRVKTGDLVSLTAACSSYILKKKTKFFKKRLSFSDREDEARLTYSLFKNYFLQWMFPRLYLINGMIIRYGLTALMSGPIVSNSKEYFNINRSIPFYNRGLFKLFIQRFTKKLN